MLANLTAGKCLADGVVPTVGETLASSLFKLIRQAFVDDGVVAEDEITPSGLRFECQEIEFSLNPKI